MDKPEGHWLELQMDGKNPQHAGVIEEFARHILHGGLLVAKELEGICGVGSSMLCICPYGQGR